MADTIHVSTSTAAMVDYPLAIQATGADPEIEYGAQEHMRQLIDAMYQAGGPVSFSHFVVTERSEGANFSVDVSAGYYVVPGTNSPATQGKYLVNLTAKLNVATPSAPLSGTRTHRLVVQVRDKAVDSGSDYNWRIWLMEDTGSGTPALPANAETLATISITNGQANVLDANITLPRAQALLRHTTMGVLFLKDYLIDNSVIYSGNPLNTDTYGGYFLPVYLEAGRRYRAKCRFRYEYTVANGRVHFYLHVSGTAAGTATADRVGVHIPFHGDNATEYPVIIEAEFNAATTGLKYITLGVSVAQDGGTMNVFRGFTSDNDQTYIQLEDLGNNTTNRRYYASGN